jgi:hypothetical protein
MFLSSGRSLVTDHQGRQVSDPDFGHATVGRSWSALRRWQKEFAGRVGPELRGHDFDHGRPAARAAPGKDA